MTTHSVNDLRPIRSPREIPFLGNTPQIPDTTRAYIADDQGFHRHRAC
ncbi:hypothetical protein ACWDZ8_15280 [Streptomyces sp. NPDC003233]